MSARTRNPPTSQPASNGRVQPLATTTVTVIHPAMSMSTARPIRTIARPIPAGTGSIASWCRLPRQTELAVHGRQRPSEPESPTGQVPAAHGEHSRRSPCRGRRTGRGPATHGAPARRVAAAADVGTVAWYAAGHLRVPPNGDPPPNSSRPGPTQPLFDTALPPHDKTGTAARQNRTWTSHRPRHKPAPTGVTRSR